MTPNKYETDANPDNPNPLQGSQPEFVSWILGIVGAIVGGAIGFYVYQWLLNQGMIAGVLPGAMVGLGFALGARKSNAIAGVIVGLAGLLFGFWCDDATNNPPQGLVAYFQNFQQVPTMNWIMVVVGGLVAYWFGKGK